jgi:hypothetical protein
VTAAGAASDGGIFSFGDAAFESSLAGQTLITSMAN